MQDINICDIECSTCKTKIFITIKDDEYKCIKDVILYFVKHNNIIKNILAYHDECEYEVHRCLNGLNDIYHKIYDHVDGIKILHEQNIYHKDVLCYDNEICEKMLHTLFFCNICNDSYNNTDFIRCKHNNKLKTYHRSCITKEIINNSTTIQIMKYIDSCLINNSRVETEEEQILNNLFCDKCNKSLYINEINNDNTYYCIEKNNIFKNYHKVCMNRIDLTGYILYTKRKDTSFSSYVNILLTDPFIKNKCCLICNNNQFTKYNVTYLFLNEHDYDFCHKNCVNNGVLKTIINDNKYIGISNTNNITEAVGTMQIYRHICPICNKYVHGDSLYTFYKKLFDTIDKDMINILDVESYDVYHKKCINKIKEFDKYIGIMKIQYPVILWQNLKKIVQNNARTRLSDVKNKEIIL